MRVSSGVRLPMPAIAAAFLAAFLLCIGISGTALAKTPDDSSNFDDYGKKETFTVLYHPAKKSLAKECNKYEFCDFSGKKVTKLKSSNKKVVAVKRVDQGYGFNVYIKGTGTAKVTFKYKGKKRVYKFVCKKYTNPFKTLKIGGQSYKGKFKYAEHRYTPLKTTGVVKVVPSKNWKLKRIEVTYGNDTTKLANGGRIYSDVYCVVAVMKNKLTHHTTYIPLMAE